MSETSTETIKQTEFGKVLTEKWKKSLEESKLEHVIEFGATAQEIASQLEFHRIRFTCFAEGLLHNAYKVIQMDLYGSWQHKPFILSNVYREDSMENFCDNWVVEGAVNFDDIVNGDYFIAGKSLAYFFGITKEEEEQLQKMLLHHSIIVTKSKENGEEKKNSLFDICQKELVRLALLRNKKEQERWQQIVGPNKTVKVESTYRGFWVKIDNYSFEVSSEAYTLE